MKRAFWFLLKTMEIVFIVFLLFVGSLFFREQRLPKCLVERIATGVSGERHLLVCDGASYGIGRGLTLSGIRLYERDSGAGISPVLSVKKLSIRFLARKVHVSGLKYPRLPESYHHGECRERELKLDFRFPDVGEFDLRLDEPDILGIRPRTVYARVEVSPETLHFGDIRLVWPDLRRRMAVTGDLDIDLKKRVLASNIEGLATQPLIRPLLVALDLPSVYPYFDAFTDVAEPVGARGSFACDLGNCDFRMELALKIGECKYNRVPFARADGVLDLYAYTRGTNCNARLAVNLNEAAGAQGGILSGALGVDLSNEVVRLSYDVKSSLAFSDALDVADFFNDGTLSFIRCDSAPEISVKGISGVAAADKAVNNVDFAVRLACGAVCGYQVRNLAADFSLKEDAIEFRKISARGRDGGRLTIVDRLEIPDFDGSRMRINPRISYTDGSLNELADIFDFDLGERDGKVEAAIELAASGCSNVVRTLSGKGTVRISEGHLAKMKLFAGLTDLLAEKVPGVESIVTQSDASCDFTIDKGVVASENIYIEGGLCSLKAWGRYDIASDNLDFTSRVQFLRNESLMGKLIHPIVWPFSKLLLEFKVKGPLDAADWEYISIIDRIL